MTETETKLQNIVAQKLKVPPDQVPLDKDFTQDMGLDSFDVMAIILEIEETFPPVSLNTDEAQNLKTLRQVGAYVGRQR
jgi:acyl carrier protein